MPEFKTNWKKSDFFNAADYNRIVDNLNLPIVRATLKPLADLQVTFRTIPQKHHFTDIRDRYNKILSSSKMKGFNHLKGEHTFNYVELNHIEGLCNTIVQRASKTATINERSWILGTSQILGGGYFG